MPFPWLPIDEVLPDLRAALAAHASVVLQAPPGAGKTTRVPLAVLEEPWLAGQRIVVLEPRRLAARAAARRMAELLGERVGETVGYRMRMESVVGPRTRIEVVTEGVLGRMLQDDPALEGVGLVVFDEYHERSLQADLGLALALQTQALLREELRLLVMSATLDGERVAALLHAGGAPPDDNAHPSSSDRLTDSTRAASSERLVPVITSAGRAFPVETRWRGPRPERVEPAVVGAVMHALAHESGDLLVFLPGTAEIRRTEEALRERLADAPDVRVLPLHGTLPQPAQDEAIRPAREGTRKVVLATSIAETSLTIEGVRVVVDSGLSRVPRFSPRSGMTRLETVRTSRASADQRRGRAGRLGPGVCYRLWHEHEEAHLAPYTTPEILDADLAPLALDLAAAGVRDPLELRWLDPPPAASFAQARELLAQLGALDARGRIAAHGARMARLPMHPRLAHLVLAAIPRGLGGAACALAALLSDRDILRGEQGPPDADVRLRLELLLRDAVPPPGTWVDREGLRRARAEAARWRERAGVREPMRPEQVDEAGVLLACAYPDRIAQRRPGEGARHLLRNGRGAALGEGQSLARAPFLVAAELDGRDRESRIFLAAPLALEDLERELGDQLAVEEVIEWDDAQRAVRAVRRERLGAIVLRESVARDADPERVRAALLDGVRRLGLDALPWSDAARGLRARLAFLRRLDAERSGGGGASWPDTSDEALLATIEEWLAPHLVGIRRLSELSRLDLAEVLRAMLPWERRAQLDELAPTHLVVPSGSRLPIDYTDPEAPMLAVRLQELFGLAETPTVARGRVPLTLALLSPAHRPVQVTRDLAGFWRSSYFDVRRDLRGRYPKHHWPENPMEAVPTARAKKRGASG
ncbi:MAG TPA: ATP-dependent helicase HrpB [Gemmatimonadaceae bacterium]|nr:ATP-dependent helicase HrpB [Gemmatimonadaceae bacterium]